VKILRCRGRPSALHPQILEVAVIPVPDEPWEEVGPHTIEYGVTLKPAVTGRDSESCRSRLASYDSPLEYRTEDFERTLREGSASRRERPGGPYWRCMDRETGCARDRWAANPLGEILLTAMFSLYAQRSTAAAPGTKRPGRAWSRPRAGGPSRPRHEIRTTSRACPHRRSDEQHTALNAEGHGFRLAAAQNLGGGRPLLAWIPAAARSPARPQRAAPPRIENARWWPQRHLTSKVRQK
jgi:hypothetical protein